LKQGNGDLAMDYEVGNLIDKHCQAMGLIVRPIINMCVMSPPLTITKAQIDEMVSILRKGIEMAMVEIESLEAEPATPSQHHPSPAA
jgi:adenosylmethionine-8-amino-7-oxononanoate aminotransferase